jgi:alpha-tubulin suppressor-like RCC1 family protein
MRVGKGIRLFGFWAAIAAGALGLGGTTSAQITVSPYVPTVAPGQTQQFIATSKSLMPLQGVKSVAAGSAETCVLMLDSTVKCWGANWNGELGNPTTTQSSVVPLEVMGLNHVTALAAGSMHVCALISDGTVKCWGYNGQGQLGNGTFTDTSTPTPVKNLTGPVVGITAGQQHTCAILSGGNVQCWGSNNAEQLGNPGVTGYTIPTPVQVTGLSFVTAISAGYAHTCVLEASGDVYCWGAGYQGQLGNNTTYSSNSPVQSWVGQVKAIAAGGNHTCALVGGEVYCWGDLSTVTPDEPNVVGVSGAKAISAGGSQACALLYSGSVECWGYNYDYQLGNGTLNYTLNSPVTVSNVTTAISIAAAGDPPNPAINPKNTPEPVAQTYAVLANGTLMAWGDLVGNSLGGGYMANAPTPVQVQSNYLPNMGVRQLANGGYHTCALMGDGTAECWGYNSFGELGNGTNTNSANPVKVSNLINAIAIAAGTYHTCALIVSGSVECWGDDAYNEGAPCSGSSCHQPQTVGSIQGAIAIAAGGTHTCALINDGTVNCWGENLSYQGCTVSLNCFNGPTGVTQAVGIAAGYSHTCALYANGMATCWGDNTNGQLGNGSSGSAQKPPGLVSGLGGWQTWATSISTGYGSTCAILLSGNVQCWGYGGLGELGNNSTAQSNVPVTVSNLSAATAIGSGWFTNCAVTAYGSLECWGWNVYGNLGNNSTANSNVPMTVLGLSSVASISAGELNTSALLSDGTVQDWGYGAYGSLGNGSTSSSLTPVATAPLVQIIWSSTSPSVASINPSTGVATGLTAGTAVIEVNYAGLIGYGELYVN